VEKAQFRYAVKEDAPLILDFIKALAEYEKMSDQVIADEKLLCEWIFEKNKAEVIFALENGKEVGFALFFHNFSTFLGRGGIWLEDLFVEPEYRGKGIGTRLLATLAERAVALGCGRMEWCCLDWNEPSIRFYRSLGATPMDEWTTYRLTGDTLTALAKRAERSEQ
jgi:GNAT superfamily N-acetyltransferase